MSKKAAPAPAPAPAAAGRPVPGGIKLLATIALLVATAKFILGILGLGLGATLGIATSVFLAEGFWGSAAWGIAQLIGAAIWAAAGTGLRSLKPWAWLVAVLAVGVSAVSGILSFLTGGMGAPVLGTIEIVLAVGILIYLFRPNVSKAFDR